MNTYAIIIVVAAVLLVGGGVLYIRYAAQVSPSIIHKGEGPVAYGAIALGEKDKPVAFDDFVLKFLGTETRVPDAAETVSFNDSRFSIIDKTGGQQIITVVSGQLPPKPTTFTVGDLTFTLWTYVTPKDERLEKDQIVVTKN